MNITSRSQVPNKNRLYDKSSPLIEAKETLNVPSTFMCVQVHHNAVLEPCGKLGADWYV